MACFLGDDGQRAGDYPATGDPGLGDAKAPSEPEAGSGGRYRNGCELTFDRVSSRPVEYPKWTYFPTSEAPPAWVEDFVAVVEAARSAIDSSKNAGLTSNAVLAALRPGLVGLGYEIEAGKKRDDKIRRPVLFGDQGAERVAYELDGIHDELGVLVEIEAGRGAMGNAVYRDLIRTSLIVGATYLALGVMLEYRYATSGITQSYRDAKGLLDTIYASGRLRLPFDGILLFGY